MAIIKFVTHPNDITIPDPMTSTVEGETGSLSYHWYKNPVRVYSNVDDVVFDEPHPDSPPIDVPTWEVGNDSIRIIRSQEDAWGQVWSQPVNYNSGKLHMKYRCDFIKDSAPEGHSYVTLALMDTPWAESSGYNWLSITYDDLSYGGGIVRGFRVEINDGSIAAVHNADVSGGAITWYTVEFEYNVDTFLYYTIVASNGEEFGGTIDLVANHYDSAHYPIPSEFQVAARILWEDEATFTNLEIYEEASRIDTLITTGNLILEPGDGGTYYIETVDDVVLLSSDIGTALEEGEQQGINFSGNPQFGINEVDTKFTAYFIE